MPKLPPEADPTVDTRPTGTSIVDVLRRKKPKIVTVTVVLDSELADAVREASAATSQAEAKVLLRPNDADAQAELREATARLGMAQEEARPETITFAFRGIGRRGYEDLRSEHPPTKEERDEYKRMMLANGVRPDQIGQLLWSNATFPPALIAASCVSHPMTVLQAKELWDSDDFNQAELDQLFSAAVAANNTNQVVDLGNA